MDYLENIKCRTLIRFFLEELKLIPFKNYDDELKEQQEDYCKSKINYYLSSIKVGL